MVKSSHIVSSAAMAIVAACILAGAAAATPAEGDVQRTDLAKGTSNTPVSIVTNGEETAFYVQSLALAPGASSGWHAHPGPEQSVITEGTVFVQSAANCIPVAYSAGQTVFLPAGVAHVVTNRGPADAGVVVTYTLPAERPVRDDAPPACP
ncbi:MAG TPA: cupin domain-containing protein [Mycobacterium sp.]|nr:cupin domain-containing protein [Mycobacterium sp.]